jgi:hypothetical protein
MPYFNRNRFYKPAPSASQYSGINNRVNDPTLKERLEKLLANVDLQRYVKTVEFMRSLLDQYNAKGSLSHNQVKCIEDNEKRYNEATLAEKRASIQVWQTSYDADKRTKMRLVAKWYKDMADAGSQPYYYRETCEKVLADESYVPSEQTYEKIVSNKFAQRYLEQIKTAPKFNNGDVVVLTTVGKNRFAAGNHSDNTFIIVEVTDKVRAAAGSRSYGLLPIGDDNLIFIEERYLKASR